MADSIFEQYVVAKWKAKGKSELKIPFARIVERRDQRLARRDRPYRKGNKIDSTSVGGRIWELDVLFANGEQEQGIDGDTQYPDNCNAVLDTIEIDETGDLTLPTIGPVRAKFKGYVRTEAAEPRDAAAVQMTFWEDNEDDTTTSSFSAPSARSVSRKIAQEATFDSTKEGSFSDAFTEMQEAASELEGLANAPGDFIDDLEAKTNGVISAVDRVEKAFTQAANEGTSEVATLLTKPEASRAGRSLRRLADVAARATTNLVGVPRIVTRTFLVDMSLFDIATQLGQDAMRLMAINKIADVLNIPKGTPVRVFDTTT